MRSVVSRRGSALLVVLGMLAFMVVSAVAFSAYMRRARLPSNYLRRATSSRELVKAALTRAIDDIDHAVNDNPHPGLGTSVCRRKDPGTGNYVNTNRNGWVGRVFMNADMTRIVTKTRDIPDGAAHPNDTVSVLSLEGLAYVPAPLQGEARYYSRRTPTAKWQSLDFDAGRYAYVALDVSDFLDVNRMFANEPRSSAANTRLTLAYLFENGGASDWDTLLTQVREVDSDLNVSFDGYLPLTSVADMNLFIGAIIGEKNDKSFRSWFQKYLSENGQITGLRRDSTTDNPRLMPLITDALYVTNDITKSSAAYAKTWSGNGEAGDPYDLASPASQPFKNFNESSPYTMARLFSEYQGSLWLDRLSLTGLSALCDYLDPDYIPTSLAIPTVERVPMICGFKTPPASGNITITSDQTDNFSYRPQQPQAGDTFKAIVTVKYHLNMGEFLSKLSASDIQVMGMYPFAHKDEARDDLSWQVDGRLALFFTSGSVNLRTENASDRLHIGSKDIPETGIDENGVLNVKLNGVGASFNAPKSSASFEGSFNSNISLSLNSAGNLTASLLAQTFITVVYTWDQTYVVPQQGGMGSWTPEWGNNVKNGQVKDETIEATINMPILGSQGNIEVEKGKKVYLSNGDPFPLANLRLNAAVWLRVLNAKGNVVDVVDMVPACVDDDAIQISNSSGLGPFLDTFRSELGKAYPLMLLDTAGANAGMASLSIQTVQDLDNYASSGVAVTLTGNSFFAPDPRYNYAPEDWVQQSGETTLNSSAWKSVNNGAFGKGASGTSGEDVYFATSDAGYLQSLYELSNLPYITELNTGNSSIKGSRMNTPSGGTAIPTAVGSTCHNGLFWQNYDPMFNDPINVESNLLFHTSYKGQRVNPYSDNMEVVRGVFANTPLDWKRASTNKAYSLSSECAGDFFHDENGFNGFRKYTWSENADDSNARITKDVLEEFAEVFIKKIRDEYNAKNWDVILRDLMNDAEPDKLGSISLGSAKLYKSDRDFLYGFWRDCFAARQQLYLIFVRAEPLMMGGAAVGSTPPQLGGRAVALVWRDPTAVDNKGSTECTGYPHSTRVLFYKNLE